VADITGGSSPPAGTSHVLRLLPVQQHDGDGAAGRVVSGTVYDYSPGETRKLFFHHLPIHELGPRLRPQAQARNWGGVANVAVPYGGMTIPSFNRHELSQLRRWPAGRAYTNESLWLTPPKPIWRTISSRAANASMVRTSRPIREKYGLPPGVRPLGQGVHQWGWGQGVPGRWYCGRIGQNRVFMTVWDGNGIDTYDLSKLCDGGGRSISIPAASSITSTTQIANLGNSHYAQGNVYTTPICTTTTRGPISTNAIGGRGQR